MKSKKLKTKVAHAHSLILTLLHLAYGESHWCHDSVVLAVTIAFTITTSKYRFHYNNESVSLDQSLVVSLPVSHQSAHCPHRLLVCNEYLQSLCSVTLCCAGGWLFVSWCNIRIQLWFADRGL